MATTPLPVDRVSRRVALVEEHVRCENAHDLDGVMRTFGVSARYDDEPWAAHYDGRDSVRAFYQGLMSALPDLTIEVVQKHVTDETIVLEVIIRGSQRGTWRGLPPTGRKVEIPLCGIYTFSADDSLAGEKIYYDRATVLRQLGVFHEPQTALGGITTLLTHPWTIMRAVARKLVGRAAE